ncbi:NUDIX hydrolase [Bacillus pseudomycoides]|uniref:NUDIX hydrolase n=1 Tax=Bacillus pseudomycoides TaxID=64104 RepID=UPI000BEC827E|nr:NUDIX hydrolase [Bacillus pseudomycoides]PED07560.1 DNA mismatch repair protein MutT [Bacillus pseudomycoides]PEI96612.1 DNA mismatch repair protein MutT [Bacillus pseudomycoides]PEK15014.1 DNA mismatch repair protein MutT [Bacillus pseudomycoides]PEM77644.1 DNA mismatch repair protein MutT [Bacillus pseudomycoides]PEO22875.1 DNA mismatch repair protein MutT [Bacillus pseudomycoides]
MEYTTPKHIVAVSACITNENNEILLVKVQWRADTWEMPGGQVEEGEPLDQAVCREVLEETGLLVKPVGITGLYYNASKHILAVVFKVEYVSGEIKVPPEEIKKAKFIALNEENIDEYITRPHMKSRILDAITAKNFIPYETWKVDPYDLIGRL